MVAVVSAAVDNAVAVTASVATVLLRPLGTAAVVYEVIVAADAVVWPLLLS